MISRGRVFYISAQGDRRAGAQRRDFKHEHLIDGAKDVGDFGTVVWRRHGSGEESVRNITVRGAQS